MFSIAGGCGHCNDKVWGCTGSSRAEKASPSWLMRIAEGAGIDCWLRTEVRRLRGCLQCRM